jgi:hypothetical protein
VPGGRSWLWPTVHRYVALGVAALAAAWAVTAAGDALAGIAAVDLRLALTGLVATLCAAACCGLAARGDRPPVGRSEVALPLLGGGLAVLLGSSGLGALAADSGSWSLPLLLGEAIAVLVVAVVAESRLCVVAAGAALAGVCLRALGMAASGLPLYAVFGGCAVVLLDGSLGLAVERERVIRLRHLLATWRP